jgi:hypothetical protein
MLSAMRYRDIAERVQKEFGFSISLQALSNFYYNHVADHVIENRARRGAVLNKINKDITKHPVGYGQSAVDAMMERIARMALDDHVDARRLKAYTDSVARLRTLDLAEADINLKLRRVAILERREKQARATLQNSKLTPEEQAKVLREILGVNK